MHRAAVLELYNSPSSTCSQKVRLSLAEKRLEWVDRRVNTLADEHLRPEYLALNPNGVVPTLVHDGQPIVDSSVICEYLEELHPEPPLSPPGALGRARMRAWMRFAEEVPTSAIRVPSFHQALARRFRDLDAEHFREIAERRPLRKHMYRRMGPQGFTPAEVQAALEQLDLTLARMEALLQQGPWLMGAQFTLADIVVIPTIDRMADLSLASRWSNLLRVAAWFDRVQARPSFAATYYKGSRLSERLEINPLAC
jgi:glutathione S-transferase